MSDWNAQLDEELEARHRQGELLAEDVSAFFRQFCRMHNLPLRLGSAIHEISLHVSEIAFSILESGSDKRWRIFPGILIQSRPLDTTTYSLFFSAEDGQAICKEFATLEDFADALGKQVLHCAGGAPQARDERRLSARRTVNVPTMITALNGVLNLTAVIINRSREGLLVELPNDHALPEEVFVLLDGRQQKCARVWQQDDRAGLVFRP